MLAARGASVAVNDLGTSIAGEGVSGEPAEAVAVEIQRAGGLAFADSGDVSVAEGAQALVASAVERFGRIDVVVNNAGIMRWAGMPEIDEDDLRRHLAVHVGSSLHTARAAWPHMVEQQYGRIVMTASTGVFGLPNNTAYATAKGGVIGLTRSLATAGIEHGIKVNAVAPAAFTRMAGPGEGAPEMAPGLAAPMVAFLAHERCPVTGEIYTAGFGRFARLFLASTPGYVAGGEPTVEDVAAHWAAINDETGYTVPRDLNEWSASFTTHLPREA
jgi:NAD(P)-dependent dehydrogenase (short-subunit alcohol dehydrogenase family)